MKRTSKTLLALVLVFSLLSTCGGFSVAFAAGEVKVAAPGENTVSGDLVSDANGTGIAAFAETDKSSDAKLTVTGDVVVSGANSEAEAASAYSYNNGGN